MGAVFVAVTKLFLISLLGFFLYRRNLVKEGGLRFLTFLVINYTVPCLIFSNLIENAQIVLAHSLAIFIVLSFCIFLLGYILGFLATLKKEPGLRSQFISVVSFQNCGYLPITIAFFLFPPGLRENFLVFNFLYLLGFNIIFWSIGSSFIFKRADVKFRLKGLFVPPITSTIVALGLVYAQAAKFIPPLLISPLKIVGETSFVLSAVILGCWLARVELRGFSKRLFLISQATILKLIVLPLLFLIGVVSFKLFSLLGLFIILQAAMPSAISLPIVANLRGADSEFISEGVFFTHIVSIFTIPLWVGLYLKLSGFSF